MGARSTAAQGGASQAAEGVGAGEGAAATCGLAPDHRQTGPGGDYAGETVSPTVAGKPYAVCVSRMASPSAVYAGPCDNPAQHNGISRAPRDKAPGCVCR